MHRSREETREEWGQGGEGEVTEVFWVISLANDWVAKIFLPVW